MRSTGDRGGAAGWSRLDSRDNALNAVRFVLAAAVIVGHSWEIGYGVKPPMVPDLAAYAVDGFFVLSGFLIAGSRSKVSFGPFLWRRALRILPGLWAVLLVTAFVFAPVAVRLAGGQVGVVDSLGYVARNAALQLGQTGIGSTLADVPVSGQWNGSLWTLSYEFACYVGLGVLFAVVRARAAVMSGILLSTAGLAVAWPPVMSLFVVQQSVRFVGFFAAGALLFLIRDRVRLSSRAAAMCMVAVVAATPLGVGPFWAIAPLPLGYVLLWVSAAAPTRLGTRNDISYGMYVYAFPVQQLLVVTGVVRVEPALFALAAIAATMPLAWASWVLVERPALRHARRTGSVILEDEPRNVRERSVVELHPERV